MIRDASCERELGCGFPCLARERPCQVLSPRWYPFHKPVHVISSERSTYQLMCAIFTFSGALITFWKSLYILARRKIYSLSMTNRRRRACLLERLTLLRACRKRKNERSAWPLNYVQFHCKTVIEMISDSSIWPYIEFFNYWKCN